MRNWIRLHPLTVFFLLAFLLSWYPWFLALARGSTTGPNPLGPFVAALLVTGIASGWSAVRSLLAKLVLWRVRPRFWLVALGVPALLAGLTVASTLLLGHGTFKPVTTPWPDVVERFLFILLFIGLGEEPGWRGFALPQLLRRFSPAKATLILSVVWALWHLPLMGHEFPLPIVPAFLVSLFGAAFVQTALFQRSQGSILLQMVLHATVNTVGSGLVFRWFSGNDIPILWWSNAILWLAAGAVSYAITSPARARREEEAIVPGA